MVQAIQTQDWTTAWVTPLFGLAVVLTCGRAWMRRPDRRFGLILTALALIGLYTLAVCGWHWRYWTKATGVETTAFQGILVGAGLIAGTAFLAVFSWLRRRRTRPGARQEM